MRMSSFYSIGLSATLALVEANCKALDPNYSPEDLQVWYSTAFNRFLNYAHSFTQTQCSMYGAAKELGIDSFIVDVRHLCSHGQYLPSLETFTACSASCMKWLRLFFWDNLLKEAKDVTAKDLPKISSTDGLVKELEFLFTIYDFTSHQIWKRKKEIAEIAKEELIESFNQYARSLESDSLMMIRAQLIKDLSVILETHRGKLTPIHIFCRLIVEKMVHFLTDPLTESSSDHLEVTVVHQNFFHLIANTGIVGEVLRKLLTTSIESSSVSADIRSGCGYWAGQILKTCWAYTEIRKDEDKRLSLEELMKINWETVNTKSLDKSIERAYSKLGLERNNSLIFGVGKKSFWEIKFTREFIKRQLRHTSKWNKEAHMKLVYFADPPLSAKDVNEFQEIITAFVEPLEEAPVAKKKKKVEVEVNMDYTIKELDDDVVEKENDPQVDMGIWSVPDEGFNWEKCPIGSNLWHVEAK